jgi:hydrogenase-4 membrane subunit HyfE
MLWQGGFLTLIYLFAWQGAVLCANTLVVAWSTGQSHLFYSALMTLALKVILLPWLLHRLIIRLNIRWDVEPLINIPIIKYSVEWWNSLHQTPTVMQMGKPKMDGDMLWPLLLMFVAFALYFVAVLLTRLRAELLRRERNASWIREVVA